MEHPEVDLISRGFLRLAAGRTQVLLGAPQAAMSQLGNRAGNRAMSQLGETVRGHRGETATGHLGEGTRGHRGETATGHLGNSHDLCWDLLPTHLQESRLRWLARALDEAGDEARAAACRAELDAGVRGAAPSDFAILSRLDETLRRGSDPSAFLEVLGQSPLAAWLVEQAMAEKDPLVRGRIVADEYRY